MLEILGALVAIGVFVFWCDVTDLWKKVFLLSKNWKRHSALTRPTGWRRKMPATESVEAVAQL
jgi:hypothetical protein